MRKKLPLILSLALVLVVLVCVSVHLIRHPLVIRFHPETAEMMEVSWLGNTVTIDRNHASFSAVCEELNAVKFIRGKSAKGGVETLNLRFFDSEHTLLCTVSLLNDGSISKDGYFYRSVPKGDGLYRTAIAMMKGARP